MSLDIETKYLKIQFNLSPDAVSFSHSALVTQWCPWRRPSVIQATGCPLAPQRRACKSSESSGRGGGLGVGVEVVAIVEMVTAKECEPL